jgi:rare lipoprotein A
LSAHRLHRCVVLLLATALLAGCFGGARRDGVPSGRLDPHNIPDAQPRHEPVTRAGNKNPYTVLGKTYRILPTAKGYRARGVASWYGSKFHGEKTANGETYDALAMTAAHTTLPIPCYVQVTNLENGRRAIVRVNDRGPFVDNRIIDLSYAAATKLGYANKGTALVEVAAIDVDNWPSREAAPAPAGVAPPVSVSDTVVQPQPSGERFYVQAGAFASAGAAHDLRRRLQQLTAEAVSVEPTASAPVLFRVRVGPLASRDHAEQVRADVTARIGSDARIVSE